ncbi:MAG TPA: HoxN/HupN/NixA family nickel/cobalt transporter [Gaiellaceae bacterium]
MARWTKILTRAEWLRLSGFGAAVLFLHLLGWGLFLYYARHNPALAGLGSLAYTFGLRHAFDADHIAAIDNTTRKLMSDGQRPLSVGFWFSLGHSTVVFALALLLAFGVRAVAGQVTDDGSTLQSLTGAIGTTVSGTFLFAIGLINLAMLSGVARAVRAVRSGGNSDAEIERLLAPRGPLSALTGRLGRRITAPWQMYPLGLLFGLGFDTATEIALLFLAAGAAFGALPFYAILCLPILFAAGMSLLDTLDGAFMAFAYGWAFARPARKLYYNLTVTGLSVVVALGIGSLELLSALGVASIDLGDVGYLVVGLFALTWLVAAGVWRFARIEQRWAP